MTEHDNDNGPGPEFTKVGEIHTEEIIPEAFEAWLETNIIKVSLAFVPEGQREAVKMLLKTTYEAGFGIGALTIMKEVNKLAKRAQDAGGKAYAPNFTMAGQAGQA